MATEITPEQARKNNSITMLENRLKILNSQVEINSANYANRDLILSMQIEKANSELDTLKLA